MKWALINIKEKVGNLNVNIFNTMTNFINERWVKWYKWKIKWIENEQKKKKKKKKNTHRKKKTLNKAKL